MNHPIVVTAPVARTLRLQFCYDAIGRCLETQKSNVKCRKIYEQLDATML
ncbi:hypothetical protein H6G96_26245 [Nostoc sp. FACHB-892]|nr:hypothetical protein [Nostoc sp. FACHB-892]MBD2729722.1 hypothetical protein [Nostoc sp. FACHB-892]